MSSDEASKVPQIKIFGNIGSKSFINIYLHLKYIFVKKTKPALLRCGLFRQSEHSAYAEYFFYVILVTFSNERTFEIGNVEEFSGKCGTDT